MGAVAAAALTGTQLSTSDQSKLSKEKLGAQAGAQTASEMQHSRKS